MSREPTFLEEHSDALEAAEWIAEYGGEPSEATHFALIDIARSLRLIVAPPQHRGEEVSTTDPTLTLLRELQCRLDDLAAQVAHMSQRINRRPGGRDMTDLQTATVAALATIPIVYFVDNVISVLRHRRKDT